MKGYTTGVGSALLALLLMPGHPVFAIAVSALTTVVILAFWTGAVRIEWEH